MLNFWTTDAVSCDYESKKGDNDQESIQSSTTSDPGYYVGSDKTELNITNQEVSPFPAGDHKAAMNRRESMTNTSHEKTQIFHKRSMALERSVKIFYWRA